jgi:hypothetical protein
MNAVVKPLTLDDPLVILVPESLRAPPDTNDHDRAAYDYVSARLAQLPPVGRRSEVRRTVIRLIEESGYRGDADSLADHICGIPAPCPPAAGHGSADGGVAASAELIKVAVWKGEFGDVEDLLAACELTPDAVSGFRPMLTDMMTECNGDASFATAAVYEHKSGTLLFVLCAGNNPGLILAPRLKGVTESEARKVVKRWRKYFTSPKNAITDDEKVADIAFRALGATLVRPH